jgi:hypothetical protein
MLIFEYQMKYDCNGKDKKNCISGIRNSANCNRCLYVNNTIYCWQCQ